MQIILYKLRWGLNSTPGSLCLVENSNKSISYRSLATDQKILTHFVYVHTVKREMMVVIIFGGENITIWWRFNLANLFSSPISPNKPCTHEYSNYKLNCWWNDNIIAYNILCLTDWLVTGVGNNTLCGASSSACSGSLWLLWTRWNVTAFFLSINCFFFFPGYNNKCVTIKLEPLQNVKSWKAQQMWNYVKLESVRTFCSKSLV